MTFSMVKRKGPPILHLRAEKDEGATAERIERIYDELEGDSDRACALVSGAFIETALLEALVQFVNGKKSRVKKLFESRGSLNNFRPKIEIGKQLGMYSKAALNEMTAICQIRNKFAHDMDVTSFDHPAVSEHVEKLCFGEMYIDDLDEIENELKKGVKREAKQGLWIQLRGRNEMLKSRRGKFLLSFSVITYGLSTIEDRRSTPPF